MAASSEFLAVPPQIKNNDFPANLAVGAEHVNIDVNKTRGEDFFGWAAKMAVVPCQNGSLDCQIDQRNTTETTDKIIDRKKEEDIIELSYDAVNELLSNLLPGKDYQINNGFVTITQTKEVYKLPRL